MSDRPTPSEAAQPTTRRAFIQRAAAVAGGLAVHKSGLARTAEAQTTKKTDLIIAQAGDISKLDPHLSTAGFDVTVTFNLYDHLVSRRRDNKLYPSLALSWSAVQPTLWQFKLRPGVKFPQW
jgi:peptide/nickel transport system substrate-binding protein